jgi:hypothetical protein
VAAGVGWAAGTAISNRGFGKLNSISRRMVLMGVFAWRRYVDTVENTLPPYYADLFH